MKEKAKKAGKSQKESAFGYGLLNDPVTGKVTRNSLKKLVKASFRPLNEDEFTEIRMMLDDASSRLERLR